MAEQDRYMSLGRLSKVRGRTRRTAQEIKEVTEYYLPKPESVKVLSGEKEFILQNTSLGKDQVDLLYEAREDFYKSVRTADFHRIPDWFLKIWYYYDLVFERLRAFGIWLIFWRKDAS